MNGPARLVIVCAIACGSAAAAFAQATVRPTPAPQIVADAETWYQRGEPVMYAGNVYYPAGPQVHFNGDEMVRSGFYQGMPLYARTTIEPYSVVFVPLSGGLMQPYERRRDGELAGTAGSSAPSFPVASPSEPARETTIATAQAAAPPMLGSGTGLAYPSPEPPETSVAAVPVGTASRVATPTRPVRRRADSANGIFVEFDRARWYSSGPSRILDRSRFRQIGSTQGFPVYAEDARGVTIYVPVASGADLVAPYSRRAGR